MASRLLCHLPRWIMVLFKVKKLFMQFRIRFAKLLGINNIYYINGSETLPPPLPAEEEDMMIRNIESDYARSCHSGNKLLDVMLHKYTIECDLRGIPFEHDVRTCNLSQVQDVDLVAIIGKIGLVARAVLNPNCFTKSTVSFASGSKPQASFAFINSSL